jgi:hypothetical protein
LVDAEPSICWANKLLKEINDRKKHLRVFTEFSVDGAIDRSVCFTQDFRSKNGGSQLNPPIAPIPCNIKKVEVELDGRK